MLNARPIRLLEEKGIEIFTPMRWRLVERKGKRIREEVPLLHDLLFAHTTRTCGFNRRRDQYPPISLFAWWLP